MDIEKLNDKQVRKILEELLISLKVHFINNNIINESELLNYIMISFLSVSNESQKDYIDKEFIKNKQKYNVRLKE